MTSTTKKARDFIGSPLSCKSIAKSVREVPGIGEAYSSKMEQEEKIRYAHQLLGLCLLYDMDKDAVMRHFTTKFGMSQMHARQAFLALEEYSCVHLGFVNPAPTK